MMSWCAYLVGYQKFKEAAEWCNSEVIEGKVVQYPVPLGHKIGVAVATGCMSASLHTPIDMLKTQAQMAGSGKQPGIVAAARAVFQSHGVKGFYTSLGAKLLRSTWYSTVTLLCMDYLNALPAHMKMKS